jgi:hypothetical protein
VPVEADCVLSTCSVRRAGDTAALIVVTDAARATIGILSTAATYDAAALMADFTDCTVEVRLTFGNTGAVDSAKLLLEAARVGFTSLRRLAHAVVTASRQAIGVVGALADAGLGPAEATGSADFAAGAFRIAGTHRHARVLATDLIVAALIVRCADAVDVIIGRGVGLVVTA